MAIDLEFYGMDLCDPMAPLVLAGPPQFETPNQQITTRIGITKDVELPLRFVDAGSDCLSRRLSALE